MTSSGSKLSVLYQVLCCLADQSNRSGLPGHSFVVVCIAATVDRPLSEWLGTTRQLICSLQPQKIDGNKILAPRDIVERLMVSDMGGHGCSLEILQMELVDYRNKDLSCSTVMDTVYSKLRQIYPGWGTISNDHIKVVIQSLLVGKKFDNLQVVLGDRTIDSYQQLGLIRWNNQSKTLECPFIWLRIVATSFCDLNSILYAPSRYGTAAYVNDPTNNSMNKVWQHWEDFVARFWCVKTWAFAGEQVSWNDLHAGALLRENNHMVRIKPLKLVKAKQHYPTKSSASRNLVVTTIQDTQVRPKECDYHILSAPGNSGGDSFCFLMESGKPAAFSISCKNIARSRTVSDYNQEFEKAASKEDFFMEFSTSKYSSTFEASHLPTNRCGLVCASNYEKYFGPFAGQAYYLMEEQPPDINTAPKGHLTLVDGIGEKIAGKIIDERSKKPFKDVGW